MSGTGIEQRYRDYLTVLNEHVFYRFREGRIAHVWSLIDRDEVRRQLAA